MYLRFVSDPGHAWLEVPTTTAIAAGMQVSQYSYIDLVKSLVYLEEDCDAPAFLTALATHGITPEIEETYDDAGWVRNLPRVTDVHIQFLKGAQ